MFVKYNFLLKLDPENLFFFCFTKLWKEIKRRKKENKRISCIFCFFLFLLQKWHYCYRPNYRRVDTRTIQLTSGEICGYDTETHSNTIGIMSKLHWTIGIFFREFQIGLETIKKNNWIASTVHHHHHPVHFLFSIY